MLKAIKTSYVKFRLRRGESGNHGHLTHISYFVTINDVSSQNGVVDGYFVYNSC